MQNTNLISPLLFGTLHDPRHRDHKIAIPLSSIKLIMEGRDPATNELVTAIVLKDGGEIALTGSFEEVTDKYISLILANLEPSKLN